jgi:hypothetical protein
MAFIQVLKKNVGANKYKSIKKKRERIGNKSKKKEKNKNSAIKKIVPGNPKNIKQLSKIAKNNFGHKKFNPLISVTNRVLNLLLTASTNKNEFVERSA